jgi:hypothetical protein
MTYWTINSLYGRSRCAPGEIVTTGHRSMRSFRMAHGRGKFRPDSENSVGLFVELRELPQNASVPGVAEVR